MAWPITAADVRTELGIGWVAPPDGQPDDLETFAAAAVERVEQEIGPRSGQTVRGVAQGPTRSVVLPWPCTELQSATVAGVAIDVGTLTLDGDAGVVRGTFGPGDVVVIATAPNTAPKVVELATRYLAATWVKQSKVGPPGPRARGGEPDTDVLQGFAMPRRVSEMIRPYVPSWGFA